MAKKKTTKKSVKKKITHRKVLKSTEADIAQEQRISKDIRSIEKDVLHDEKLTNSMAEKIVHLNEKVKDELKNADVEIKNIRSKEVVSHKKLFFWLAIIAVLIVVIALSFNAYNNYQNKQNEYNSYQLVQASSGEWIVDLSFGPLPFYYHPRDVDMIPVDPNAQKALNIVADNGGQIVISLDIDAPLPNQGIAAIEISKVTTQLYNIPTVGATTKQSDDPNVPVATCDNSGIKQLVYEVRITNKNEILYENECIILEAKSPEELIKVTDAYIYRMLGVIA